MKFSPHFAFNGNCREAFKFYAEVFGGKIVFEMTYGESPACAQTPTVMRDQIIHARVDVGGQFLMGADVSPEHFKPSQGTMVTVSVDKPADADRLFNALSMGGNVTMPIQETFFAHRFGMCADRFGTPWMIIAEKKPS